MWLCCIYQIKSTKCKTVGATPACTLQDQISTASALQHMLNICEYFAISHGLMFNEDKTQLICFCTQSSVKQLPITLFNNTKLPFLDSVVHLGHILTLSLDDKDDIIRVIKDMNRKANFIFVNSMRLTHSSSVSFSSHTAYPCMVPPCGLYLHPPSDSLKLL